MSEPVVTESTYRSAVESLPVLRRRLEQCERIDAHGALACRFRRAVQQCEAMIEVFEGAA